MQGFERVHFKGTFRDYQQRVLDRADGYLRDGKLHIVAAPGSGKTVLGLELIRKIGKPCLILSPTTAIREQWRARFCSLFADDEQAADALFSCDLHDVRLITSVTYQALYTAMERTEGGEDDCSDIDLMQLIGAHEIGTICLDEAHHLRNEWQRALEKFMQQLDGRVTVLSLTATPPYDAEGGEWERYIAVCGEIDEEIFVPELVAQGTLCPHQDYVYFNYPTRTELAALEDYRAHAAAALDQIAALPFVRELCARLQEKPDYDAIFSAPQEYTALFCWFRSCGLEVGRPIERQLAGRRGLPRFQIGHAEQAIGFLINDPLLSEEQKKQIEGIVKSHGVYERRQVQLRLSEKLRRTLVSSVGKLDSIRRIVQCERDAMGGELRLLILTDYIKKETLDGVASRGSFSSVNVVSIFETLRRADDTQEIGVLSGSLIILPEKVKLHARHTRQHIPGTRYCVVDVAGSLHTAVAAVGELFERGEIRVLIGTKSLLGEGWDSPCINALILASFVGSFVLSNQMRGRAIRIDPTHPQKVANIWHLITVEPPYAVKERAVQRLAEQIRQDDSRLISCDYEVLKRRFDTFMGPNDRTGAIESGIGRLTTIAPPYDSEGIARIDAEMLERASHREKLRAQWQNAVRGGVVEVTAQSVVPTEKRVPVFTFWNVTLFLLLAAVQADLVRLIIMTAMRFSAWTAVAVAVGEGIVCYLLYRLIRYVLLNRTPARSIKTLGIAIYEALCECSLIAPSARVECRQDKQLSYVSLYLRNASVHDQNVFNRAMAEFLSSIDNPRYLLIRRNVLGKPSYRFSFACPSVIGKKKEYAEVLAKKLKKVGRFELVFTRREDGRRLILTCRKKSYINVNQRNLEQIYRVD